MKGCTWDAQQCQGKGQLDCALPDFGKVPKPSCNWEASWCEGEPVPCAQLSQADCASAPGCKLAPAP